ncbi:MAG: hypothetical protein RL701_1213 [Pseudomonadota bacterium]
MTVEPRDLVAHLTPEITEGRLARQWAALESKRPRDAEGSRRGWRIAGLAVAMCGALALYWWSPVRLPQSGAVLESSDTPTAMQLRDGTNVALSAQTSLRVLRDLPGAVEVELAQGTANFDVTHVERRSFAVRAGVVAVHVVGTKFEVTKITRPEGQEITVSVERGIVAVERTDRGDFRRLMAGEKWSAWVPAETPVAAAVPTPADLEVADLSPASDLAEPAEAGEVRDDEPAEAAEDNEPEASAPAEGRVSARATRQSLRAQRGAAARGLFARASVARRAGLMSEAADIYAELLRRYPRDTRAAVSAFELGRIRMDALGDPRGAARAFSQALRLSRQGQFREDALARITIASDALGDRALCRKQRERYLTEFPEGVHAASLARSCGAAQH